MNRRRFLRVAAASALATGIADAFGLEPRWLELTTHTVPVPGLARELEGYTLAQLTDVHLATLGVLHDAIAAAVHAQRPQCVALTGDIVEDPRALPALTELCARLAAPGRTLLATLGNWEHWGGVPRDALARAYARAGATLLGDEHRVLPGGLVVAATDDGCTGRARMDLALQDLPPGPGRVLLTHAPGILDTLPRGVARFDLVLAGHTHGGQVRAGTRAIAVPPGSGRFVAGGYGTRAGFAYVSRGIGTSIVPARFLCRPELPVFRLVRA